MLPANPKYPRQCNAQMPMKGVGLRRIRMSMLRKMTRDLAALNGPVPVSPPPHHPLLKIPRCEGINQAPRPAKALVIVDGGIAGQGGSSN